MKRIKNLLLIIIISVIGIIIIPNTVSATEKTAYVGNKEIHPGETKDLYGGTVTFAFDNTLSKYKLTIKDVNITDYADFGTGAYMGIYFSEDLVLELKGKNTIESLPETEQLSTFYFGAGSNDNLYVIGEGTLNINIKNYVVEYGLTGDAVYIGEESSTKGPTINVNAKSPSMAILAYPTVDIYNSTIKGEIQGENAFGLYSSLSNPSTIKNSDLNIKVLTTSSASGIYYYSSDLLIENCEMLIKGQSLTDNDEVEFVGIAAGTDMLTVKDSKIVDLLTGDNSISIQSNGGHLGTIKYDHTNNKEYLFLANTKMDIYPTITYNNITDDMTYASDTSFDDLTQSTTNDLRNKKYAVITTGITNKIVSGNNQKVNTTKATSYNFKTNHFRYLVETIKLDNTLLSEEDYELAKDGTVSLTDTGLTKLFNLKEGKHTIDIDYYYGNSLTINLNTSSIDNPDTGDNIISIIILGSVSLIGLIGIGIYLKKRFN